MKNLLKKLSLSLSTVVVGMLLASCQTAPVKSVLTFTNAEGAGEKTIMAAALVDGSCQLPKAGGDYAGLDYWDASGIDSNNPADWPGCTTETDFFGGPLRVSSAIDVLRHPTNPNATVPEVWAAVKAYVVTLAPQGFTITYREVSTAGWSDAMMTDPSLNTDNDQWKAVVFELKYSFENFAEYKAKTRALIGEEPFDIDELDDNFVTFAVTRGQDGEGNTVDQITYTETSSVLFYSVLPLMQTFHASNYHTEDRGTYGLSVLFTTSDVEVVINGQSTIALNSDKAFESNNAAIALRTLSFNGAFDVPTADNSLLVILGLTVGVLVLAGVGFILLKKKPA
jgi:hypothetical protein